MEYHHDCRGGRRHLQHGDVNPPVNLAPGEFILKEKEEEEEEKEEEEKEEKVSNQRTVLVRREDKVGRVAA